MDPPKDTPKANKKAPANSHLCQNERDDYAICLKLFGQRDASCRHVYNVKLSECLEKHSKLGK
jgi:hypothetical protein